LDYLDSLVASLLYLFDGMAGKCVRWNDGFIVLFYGLTKLFAYILEVEVIYYVKVFFSVI